jgi:hypothetical protein
MYVQHPSPGEVLRGLLEIARCDGGRINNGDSQLSFPVLLFLPRKEDPRIG